MLMAWCWARVVRALKLPFAVAVLGVALVLVNPFLLSAVGLEVLLIPTLLVALVATALEGRVKTFGLVAGLLLLTRLDLIVFVGLVAAATAVVRRHWARTLTTVALIAWSVGLVQLVLLRFGSAGHPADQAISNSPLAPLGLLYGSDHVLH